MKQKIAIIGAGLSGLVTAKTLLEYGHEVIVFEKETEIGGVWSPCRHYPGLTTQNTRDTYAFTDFRMPNDYPEFPSGWQMLAYLKAYASHFGITPHIRLGHKIETVVLEKAGTLTTWTIKGKNQEEDFYAAVDFLVVCNGTFSEPNIPVVEGMDAFVQKGGKIAHTSTFGLNEKYKDKKVVVVGYGKSACDVASGIAEEAQETHLVYRHPKWKVPKRIMGINYKYIVLSRFGEALTKMKFRSSTEKIIHAIGLPGKALGTMERIFSRQQRLKECGLIPAQTIVDQLFGELSVESDGFFQKILDRKIIPVQGEINAYYPGGVHLTNGEQIPADLVVYGTGFMQKIPFLSNELVNKMTDSNGNFLLYRHILPPFIPGLAFIGYNTSFFCNLTSEMGALWLAEFLQGNIALPAPDVMLASEVEHLQWRMQFRQNSLFRNASVYPFNISYVDWLLNDMHAKLPLRALLSEWLTVIEPSNYAPVKQKIKARNGKMLRAPTSSNGTSKPVPVEKTKMG